MKILYTHLYDASFGMGGAERVLLDIAVAAKERGCSVAVAVNESRLAEKLREAGIPVVRIFWSKPRTFHTLLRLWRLCKQFEPDVIHSHHRYTTFLADLFLQSRAPVLHTEHVLRNDKRLLFRAGTKISAVHETVAQNLVNYFKVSPLKVVTIPNAVKKPEARSPRLNSIRQRYLKSPEELWAFFIGRLEEQKGHSYLIQAVALLDEKTRSKLRVFLAGDGSLEASLKEKVRTLKVENNFVFLGHTDEVNEWLELCDFVVLSSLWEGMPLSVLEAFGAGKAVLATDIPGTREVMIDGETGWLVKAADSAGMARGLNKVLSQPQEIIRMGKVAQARWRKEYSFDVMMDRYMKVYQDMSEGRA